MNPEIVQAALLAWFSEYGELGDLVADAAETGDDDPTVQEALWEQMGRCLDVANTVITLLGKQVLEAPVPAGSDAFTPPF